MRARWTAKAENPRSRVAMSSNRHHSVMMLSAPRRTRATRWKTRSGIREPRALVGRLFKPPASTAAAPATTVGSWSLRRSGAGAASPCDLRADDHGRPCADAAGPSSHGFQDNLASRRDQARRAPHRARRRANRPREADQGGKAQGRGNQRPMGRGRGRVAGGFRQQGPRTNPQAAAAGGLPRIWPGLTGADQTGFADDELKTGRSRSASRRERLRPLTPAPSRTRPVQDRWSSFARRPYNVAPCPRPNRPPRTVDGSASTRNRHRADASCSCVLFRSRFHRQICEPVAGPSRDRMARAMW